MAEIFKEITNKIKNSNQVFIMGHNDIDIDALGACVAISLICNEYSKDNYIVINEKEKEPGVEKTIEFYKINNIIDSHTAAELKKDNCLLIIVDVNNIGLIDKEVIDLFENVLVIDHHKNSHNISYELSLIDTKYSSTCEILTSMLIELGYNINKELATVLLAGIVLDTYNYIIRVTSNTFFCSYRLVDFGADINIVQFLLKSDFKAYMKRQKVIIDTKIIKKIAISKGLQTEIYRKEELAKIADTLLLFNNVEASIVIGKISKKSIGISARSIGKIDVSKIMHVFDGGGDQDGAAAQLDNTSLSKVEKEVKNIINHI